MAKYVTIQVARKEPPPEPPAAGERCKNCNTALQEGELERHLRVCPHCSFHYPMPSHERVALLADKGTVSFVGEDVRAVDPLEFIDLRPYPDRLAEAQRGTGLSESFLAATCKISGNPAAIGVLDFKFLGGSMGSVVGERFYRLSRAALEANAPLIVVAGSGGARMQEGLFSLMQMAKTVVSVQALSKAGLPYITILTHPTTGGVFASFATVADVILAEPGAVMSFAGARIIEQTTREKLPPGFGSSESQLAHGQVDMVVDRREMKERLIRVLSFLMGGGSIG